MSARLLLIVALLLPVSVYAQALPPIPTKNLPAPPSGGSGLTNGDVVVGDRVISGVNGSYGFQYNGNGTCTVNQFMNGYTAGAGPACQQLSFSNLSGMANPSQLPTIPLGSSTNTANPSVSGDAATGFYTPGSSQVGVVAGGVAQLDVKQNGIVVGAASGGSFGSGTLNATGYYINGIPVISGTGYFGTSATATNPSVNGDATTGFYTPGAGEISAAANGVNQLVINPNGVVIGTATGGPQGVGTINASQYYVNGVPIGTGTITGGLAFQCLRQNASGNQVIWGNCLGSAYTAAPSSAGIVTQAALNLATQSGLNIVPQ